MTLRPSALLRVLLGLSFLACIAAPSAAEAADERVDLELVLAVDVSGSMDADEQILQRSGYVDAIRSTEVMDAIRTGLTGAIALTYVEWAGPSAQRIVVPWTRIDGPAAAEQFTARLLAAPLGTMRGTSISGGLLLSAMQFQGNGFEGLRRVIDISGDGPNNMGPPVIPTRDQVLALGIVINGLPITLKPGGGYGSIHGLDTYYANCVIGGPGSFIVPVTDRSQLVDAIRRKLVLEIADLGGGEGLLATPVADEDFDCMIGEKLRQRWMDP
jgi:hypothetical protein